MNSVVRWLPASGLLAVVPMALTGLIALAAAAAAALQVVAWISFFAPSGILAAGALPDIAAFASLRSWLGACSIVMLVEQRRRAA